MTDWLKVHKDKQKERQALHQRQQTDAELVTSHLYRMKQRGSVDVSDVINVTMNRLKVFKAYVVASLNKADEKVYVESEDEKIKIKTDKIEDFIRAGFAAANHKRRIQGEFDLEPYMDEQSCMRGELANKILFQMKTNEEGEQYLDAEITPWDSKSVECEKGSDGLSFASFETEKKGVDIEGEEWAGIESSNLPLLKEDKDYKCVEIWTPEENIIYLDDKKVFEQENWFGFVPVCVQPVPIGTLLSDKDSIEYTRESIFFLVREMIEQYNMCMTILQTHNFKQIKPAVQRPLPDELPINADPGNYEDITAPGSITGVKGGFIQPIDIGEVRRAMILALQEINKALDDGTMSRIMLGDLPGEMSAVALVQVEQGQGQVYMPRLGARGLQKTQLAYMAIKQTQMLGESAVELGAPGHKKAFKVSDLEGEYSIGFNYANKNPETDYARVSIAKSYENILDELTILDEVIKRDDPEGDLNKIRRQRLRAQVPELNLYDGLMALAELYEDGDESAADEILIVEKQLGVSLDSMAGRVGQAPQANRQPALPIFAGDKSSARKAAELKATPEPTEGED